MSFINNLSMRGKLIALVLPALVALILFAAQSIKETASELSSMQHVKEMVRLADIGDPVAEELQRERGRSAVFIASDPGSEAATKAAQALQAQRQATDRALSGYRTNLKDVLSEADFDAAVRDSIERFTQDAGNLSALRQQVDARAASLSESASQYTGLIASRCSSAGLRIRNWPARLTPILPWPRLPRCPVENAPREPG
ncbi:MAG: methyl-accepting chemotaxis protein [Marinobacter sp. T13-3]|nr:MAG: methyl-accepting chemotaxis protein [Marinobacter sp. T13-3]